MRRRYRGPRKLAPSSCHAYTRHARLRRQPPSVTIANPDLLFITIKPHSQQRSGSRFEPSWNADAHALTLRPRAESGVGPNGTAAPDAIAHAYTHGREYALGVHLQANRRNATPHTMRHLPPRRHLRRRHLTSNHAGLLHQAHADPNASQVRLSTPSRLDMHQHHATLQVNGAGLGATLEPLNAHALALTPRQGAMCNTGPSATAAPDAFAYAAQSTQPDCQPPPSRKPALPSPTQAPTMPMPHHHTPPPGDLNPTTSTSSTLRAHTCSSSKWSSSPCHRSGHRHGPQGTAVAHSPTPRPRAESGVGLLGAAASGAVAHVTRSRIIQALMRLVFLLFKTTDATPRRSQRSAHPQPRPILRRLIALHADAHRTDAPRAPSASTPRPSGHRTRAPHRHQAPRSHQWGKLR